MSFFNDECDLVDDEQYDLITTTIEFRRRVPVGRSAFSKSARSANRGPERSAIERKLPPQKAVAGLLGLRSNRTGWGIDGRFSPDGPSREGS